MYTHVLYRYHPESNANKKKKKKTQKKKKSTRAVKVLPEIAVENSKPKEVSKEKDILDSFDELEIIGGAVEGGNEVEILGRRLISLDTSSRTVLGNNKETAKPDEILAMRLENEGKDVNHTINMMNTTKIVSSSVTYNPVLQSMDKETMPYSHYSTIFKRSFDHFSSESLLKQSESKVRTEPKYVEIAFATSSK